MECKQTAAIRDDELRHSLFDLTRVTIHGCRSDGAPFGGRSVLAKLARHEPAGNSLDIPIAIDLKRGPPCDGSFRIGE